MSKPSIEKIVFNVRNKKLELSRDEAKELKCILEELFGVATVIHSHEYVPYRPWIPWSGIYWSSNGFTSSGNSFSAAPQGNSSSDTLYLNIN